MSYKKITACTIYQWMSTDEYIFASNFKINKKKELNLEV